MNLKKGKIKLGLETWSPKKKFLLGSKEIKDIISVFILIAVIVGGIKLIQITSEYQYFKNTRDLYTASIAKNVIDYSFLKPFRNWNIPAIENISAKSVAIMVTDGTAERFIFEKNAEQILPMGSIAKLFSAYIVLENYELDHIITISEEASQVPGIRGYFAFGEKILVQDLLYSMLIESSNDSVKAIADDMGEREFVKKMNEAVKNIGLEHTYFVNPTGLDPKINGNPYNYSTSKDLARFAKYLLNEANKKEKIAKIFEITAMNEHKIHFADGREHHNAITTNKIIEDYPNIIAAKTGQTALAGQCFLVILPRPKGNGNVIYVVLDSSNRFSDAKKLIEWSQEAFIW